MKRLLIICLSAVLMIGTATASHKPTRVGVIDLQKIIKESKEVTTLRAQLKKRFGSREEAIVTAEKALKADQEKVSRDKAVMKAGNLKALQEKIAAAKAALQAKQTAFFQDFGKAQRGAMESLMKKVSDAVSTYATKNHYDLIVQKRTSVFASNTVNVTDDVLKILNK